MAKSIKTEKIGIKTKKTGKKTTKKFNPDFIVDFTNFGKGKIDDILLAFAEAKYNSEICPNKDEVLAVIKFILYRRQAQILELFINTIRSMRHNNDNVVEKKNIFETVKQKIRKFFIFK